MEENAKLSEKTTLSLVDLQKDLVEDLEKVQEVVNEALKQEELQTPTAVSPDQPEVKKFKLTIRGEELEFSNAFEVFETILHLGGFTNKTFHQIYQLAPFKEAEFVQWVDDKVTEAFGKRPLMGSTVIRPNVDDDKRLAIEYFIKAVGYDPEKCFLILNQHNKTIARDIVEKLGIGTIMLFHALKTELK